MTYVTRPKVNMIMILATLLGCVLMTTGCAVGRLNLRMKDVRVDPLKSIPEAVIPMAQ